MTHPITMSCDDLDRALPDYLAGALSEREALALERHAASCARCEARLDAATRRPVSLELPDALRDGLRKDTLRAVASSRTARSASRTWMWAGGVTTMAAAALVFIVMRGTIPSDGSPGAVDSARGPDAVFADMDEVPARARVAARLADQEARSEFAALDAAAREIEAALAAAPADRELRAYLSSVRARRDELARRVKAATS